ncbi:putative frv operon regulatory protein [Trabulsiella odontotermitis]|uniref:putative frv operon regulatory protein n=1 Tax=Trabulsiella odontotermitis TaxID=379893 RepID=UPI0006768651|nr:putative frv operon regulatory protein [Trabulsiella odontotermitis]KNC89801.1 frv operon regulatory protein [Trabulsiella odontotermitis]
MLNERQLTLLARLEHQPCSLNVLAQLTGVSGRTILRDIDYLNFTLSGKARVMAVASVGYQLEIFDRRSYFELLQRHDNDDRLLAMLLLNAFVTRTQLANTLNLPETWVAERLVRLKARYEKAFSIQSRPGAGHFIDEPEEKSLVLLANLLKKDPLLFPLPGIDPDSLARLQEACTHARDWPAIPADYLASIILAVYALRNRLSPDLAHFQNETLQRITDSVGLWLGADAFSAAVHFLDSHQQRAETITTQYIAGLLRSLPELTPLHVIDPQLIEDLTGHIVRCSASPVWLPENRQGSMNNLKAAWPAAFDLGIQFINKLREQQDIPVFDSDLVGLYFACALERHQQDRYPVILLADQNAIATINKQAIERDVMNCRVMIARTPAELRDLCADVEPALIVNNSHHFLDDAPGEVLIVKNIITPATIGQIKDLLASAFIRQRPERFFLSQGSFHYANARDEAWQSVMANICKRLTNDGHLTVDEAWRIEQREREGENLIVNQLAIPHCWSERQTHFRGYFITLAQSVSVNNEPVSHVLIACASASARQELKIFSYLASVLYRYPPTTISGLSGYEDFLALLRG